MATVFLILALLGFTIGGLLGLLSSRLSQDEDPVVQEVEALMPGSQCAQCGFAGCGQAAQAMVERKAPVTVCPPGGASLAIKVAQILGIAIDTSSLADRGPRVAVVGEDLCIGCTKCYRVCPTDAIVGAPKQIHSVLEEFCTACGACVDACPTQTMLLQPKTVGIDTWRFPKPRPHVAA